MLQVNKRLPQGRGLAPALLRRAATVELDWDLRQKSRLEATDSAARHLGIFLPRGQVLRGGDVLVAEDGSLVRVIAAPQPVLRITACTEHGTPLDLPRAAYHLGNRHVALEVQAGYLQIEPDPVLAEMLRAMHLTVAEIQAPFEPEAGAYAHAGTADTGHAAGPAQPHVHGPACGHDHDAPRHHNHGPADHDPR